MLLIQDKETSFFQEGVQTANTRRQVSARPNIKPFYVMDSLGNFNLDETRLHVAVIDDDGNWYLELPWPSESNPSNVIWTILRSDSTAWSGTVPEGIVGPLSIDDLINSYGWGASSDILQTTNITVVTGPAGRLRTIYLTAPSELTVTGSPAVTGVSTLALDWATQLGNLVLASPNGTTGTPVFRALTAADIPNLDVAKITTGTFSTSFIPSLNVAKITTGRFTSAFIPTDVAYTDVANIFTQDQTIISYFIVKDTSVANSSIRLRNNSSVSNIEVGGGAGFISAWDNADFTGTQHFIMKLDPNNSTTELLRGIYPTTNNTIDNGTSANYWANTFSKRLLLNSTAILDGNTAGSVGITGSVAISAGNLLIQDSGPTKGYRFRTNGAGLDLEISGASLYISGWTGAGFTGTQSFFFQLDPSNTSMNFKKSFFPDTALLSMGLSTDYWLNTYTKNLYLNSTAYLDGTTAGLVNLTGKLSVSSTDSNSSGAYNLTNITPTIAQTGSASYTALSVNVTESSLGSGTSYLLDLKKGGVSQFQVQNTQPHVYINSSASSTSFPTTLGMANFGSGNAARVQFGDDNTCIQNAFGQSMQITSYWGLELIGNTQGATPFFHQTAGIAVLAYSSTNTDIGLVIRGTSGQSADLQQWQDSTTKVLAKVSNNGIFNDSTGAMAAGRIASWARYG